jgi:hypothetical protein
MGANCVSACEQLGNGDVRRCWYAAPLRRFERPSHPINWVYTAIFGRRFRALRRALVAFALLRLSNFPLGRSDPTRSLGMANFCAMMHGLAISLPESARVHSPLR